MKLDHSVTKVHIENNFGLKNIDDMFCIFTTLKTKQTCDF